MLSRFAATPSHCIIDCSKIPWDFSQVWHVLYKLQLNLVKLNSLQLLTTVLINKLWQLSPFSIAVVCCWGCANVWKNQAFVDVMLFTFSINFSPLTLSLIYAYDDIIKLNTEHLTCHPSSFWRCHHTTKANRNINIHSCIQWTWMLLHEVNNFNSFYFFLYSANKNIFMCVI